MEIDEGDASAESSRGARRRDNLVRTAFVTEEAIYGVLLVSGMIIVAGSYGSSSWQVFWTVVITVVVFWAAHVYAGTVSRHGLAIGRVMALRPAFVEAFEHSLGLL